MLILELAAGILPGVVIVFSGVWMVLYWTIAERSTRRALSIAMVASLAVVLICFIRVTPAAIIVGAAALPAAIAFLALRRLDRPLLPAALAKALYKPTAVFVGGAGVISTIALFAALQQGPQAEMPILEMGALAAGLWALMLVGGVWAKKNMPTSRPAADRREATTRYGQSPFRKFSG